MAAGILQVTLRVIAGTRTRQALLKTDLPRPTRPVYLLDGIRNSIAHNNFANMKGRKESGRDASIQAYSARALGSASSTMGTAVSNVPMRAGEMAVRTAWMMALVDMPESAL